MTNLRVLWVCAAHRRVNICKFSVLLVSQTSCLIMEQLDPSSSWDETSYGKDYGHRFSLSGLDCKNSGNWNGAVLVRA